MKKIILAIMIAFLFISMSSCTLEDCGCDTQEEVVELRNPEVTVYKMYSNSTNTNTLRVYKYETDDAFIYRYVIGGETRNINVVPKNTVKQTESVLKQESYFDF